MNILVTGGAGYIGSHACKALSKRGYHPITVDNLVYGHKWAVKWGPFYQVDIHDTDRLVEIMRAENIQAVMHFAAYAYVGESMREPLKYYENNLAGTLSLLKAMKVAGINKIVFSSTCATYGVPRKMPISEDTPQVPINPYGRSKWMIENVLRDLAISDQLRSVSLRYFNAAGADPQLEIGEDHDPETHLIPLAIEALEDASKALTIFGDKNPTPDGTCVRDYIHVSDLASAHILALEYLVKNEENLQSAKADFFNLGTGQGQSVRQVIDELSNIAGRRVHFQLGSAREGDPPELVANATKAKEILGWLPQKSDLKTILFTALEWQKKHFPEKLK